MAITFRFTRNTKNYSVYEEVGGYSKLYLPLGETRSEITVTV